MFPWKQKPGVSGGLTETIFHISTVRQSRGCPHSKAFYLKDISPGCTTAGQRAVKRSCRSHLMSTMVEETEQHCF